MPILTKSEILKLQKVLKTDASIARLYGITRQAIYGLRKMYNIPSSRIGNHKRNIQISRMYNKRINVESIADKFNLSMQQVYKIIREI